MTAMKSRLLALVTLCSVAILTNIKLAFIHDAGSLSTFEELAQLGAPELSTSTNKTNALVSDYVYTISNGASSRNGEQVISSQLEQNASLAFDLESSSQRIMPQPTRTVSAADYKVAGLNCAAHGGPANPSDMVYWSDIPQDDEYMAPYYNNSRGEPRDETYMTFEPDEGGFNNIRMAMETVIAMAVAMGRTLVLPPSQEMYLLGGDNKTTQRNHFSFTDFYPLEAVAREHKGLKLITMEEFLQKKELLINRTSGVPMVPLSRIDWNGASKADIRELHEWLRWVGQTPAWGSKCIVGFAPTARKERRFLMHLRRIKNTQPKNLGNLTDGSIQRTIKALAHRREICVYDMKWQSTKVIHFTGDIASGTRMLIHFYAYLFFVRPTVDRFIKRFVRDHLRYVDEIQCAAARIVEAMQEKARLHSGVAKEDQFDTFHVRRGDFRVIKAKVDVDEIYANIADVMTPKSTLYIATDEVNRSFFEPFYRRHHVYFLNDFEHLIKDLNTNYYGLVEQLVVARGRIFVGCMYSTFSSFVTRLRGYHSTHRKLPGYESGTLPTTYYYAPLRYKECMHNYTELSKPLTYREFPMAWTDIELDEEKQEEY